MDEKDRLTQLTRELDDWQSNVLASVLTRTPERKTECRTGSGIKVDRVYTPLDLADHDYLERLGFPGGYPYTRGVRPTMYRSRLWTMREYAGYGTAEETNRRFHFLLEQGQTGLSVAFDLPTNWGTTLMIRSPSARWGGWVSPSTLWPIWRRCCEAFRSIA